MTRILALAAVTAAVLSGCSHNTADDTKTSTITQPPVTVTNTPTSTTKVAPTETKVVQPTDTVTAPTQTVTQTP